MENNNKILKRVQDDNSGVRDDNFEGKRIRVAIGMSGGVDSSVAAKILLDQGYDVVGFMMKLWSGESCTPSSSPSTRGRDNACCDIDGLQDAKRIAAILDIPFYVVDVRKEFKKEVADYFVEEYKNLRTPNPCVKCNEKIKFGWLLDFAKKTGCDFLATGHYTRIASESSITKGQLPVNNQSSNSNYQNAISRHPELDSGSRNYTMDSGSQAAVRNDKEWGEDDDIYKLLKGKDEAKDQSYFLYRLNQEQLSKIIFPVGEYSKKEVRAMAKNWNLPVHKKKESQEICFIQEKDYREFLRKNIPTGYFKSGDIVDLSGDIIGKHDGLINYTIGQRKGIEQSKALQISNSKFLISNQNPNSKLKNDKNPLYVMRFNVEKNQLIVGEDEEIYRDEMIAKDLNWIDPSCHLSATASCGVPSKAAIVSCQDLKVKIRYRHAAVGCTLTKIQNTKYKIQFDQPQRAITPGQSAVFYNGDEVLGGGIIEA